MHGRPLTAEAYDDSRWIVEPWRLFDCCQENDGAAALILVPAEQARDFRHPPAYLLGSAQGSEYRNGARGHNAPLYATSSFTTVAPQLYDMAGVKPADVDVVQSYENFTGGVLMSLVEHGFFTAEEANDFLTPENLIGARPASCRSTPPAAISPNATCTASSCRSRRCASCAASRPNPLRRQHAMVAAVLHGRRLGRRRHHRWRDRSRHALQLASVSAQPRPRRVAVGVLIAAAARRRAPAPPSLCRCSRGWRSGRRCTGRRP